MSDNKEAGFEAHQRSQGGKRKCDSDSIGNNPDDNTDTPSITLKYAKTCRERTEAGESALSNDLVLRCVFEQLSTPDLLGDCRLVCKHWNRVATEALRKRSDAYVKVNAKTDLNALTDCIKTSPNFPAAEIDISITNLDFKKSPKTWLELELLNRYSRLFTRLRLRISADVQDKVVFRLLSGHFNHIALLNLNAIGLRSGNGDNFWDNGKNNFKMNNLAVIVVGTEAECDRLDLTFLEALLQSCPKLKRIENPTNAHLHAVSRAGKLGTVKSLRVCCCIEKDKNHPKPSRLKTLIVLKGDHEKEYGRSYTARTVNFSCLQPLLELNRGTLKRIDVCTAVVGGTRICDWPTLSKLTFLNLLEPLEFPDSVQDIFPALETIRLVDCDRNHSLSHYLWNEPLPSVTKLELFQSLRPGDCMRISKALPNVRHMFVDWKTRCPRDFNYSACFWSDVSCFKNLKTLIISPITCDERDWDRYFTGIPPSCLRDLRANPQVPVPAPEYIDAVLRERKSIASVSGLKELVVHFTVAKEATAWHLREAKSFSHVAMQYAFALTPADLQIKFMYDYRCKNAYFIKEALGIASERVIFDHWNDALGYYGMSHRSDGLVALQSRIPERSMSSRPSPRVRISPSPNLSPEYVVMTIGSSILPGTDTGSGKRSLKEAKQRGNNFHESSSEASKHYKDGLADELALSNDGILKCIFNHLTTADLVQSCRLVTKNWNLVATEALKTRSDACVKVNARRNLEALAACIKSSSDFPFCGLDLQCWGVDFEKSPKEWLEVELVRQHSKIFTRLTLLARNVPATVVSSLLSGPFSHIVSLTLNWIEPDHENKKSTKYLFCDENISPLKNLKVVALGSLGGDSPISMRCDSIELTFLQALLQSSPNVERIENFTIAHLYAVAAAGKLHAVKSLRVCACKQGDINYPMPSGLETLIIADSTWPPLAPCTRLNEIKFSYLQPLLEANQQTLRRMEVYTQVIGGRNSADWPKLNKLTSLKLAKTVFFPHSVNEIFPALRTLEFKSPKAIGGCHYSFKDFIWKEPLPGVTTLEVSRSDTDSEDWSFISKAVPNVRHLFVGSGNSVEPWVGASSFKCLETCHMSPVKLPGTNLDKFFTGIPESFLEILRKNPELPVPAPEFVDAVLRKDGSPASLSSLKELVIHFTLFDEITMEELKCRSPLSHVAMRYGLSMAPRDVKIRFMYDHSNPNAQLLEEFFSPVSERVSFGHWNADLGYWGSLEPSGGLDDHLRQKKQEELDKQIAQSNTFLREMSCPCTCTHDYMGPRIRCSSCSMHGGGW